VRVSRTHFASRGPHRGTTIRFRLTRPGAVELVVTGPSPSCDVVGRKWVPGHGGVNRVRFSGRVHGHPLAPGRYAIAVVVVRGGSPRRIGKIGIEVVPPGRRVTHGSAPVEAPCAASSSGPSLPAVVIGATAPAQTVGVAGASASRSTPRTEGPGTRSLRPPHLGPLGDTGTDLSWAILAVIAALVLGIGVYVARYLRGTPST